MRSRLGIAVGKRQWPALCYKTKSRPPTLMCAPPSSSCSAVCSSKATASGRVGRLDSRCKERLRWRLRACVKVHHLARYGAHRDCCFKPLPSRVEARVGRLSLAHATTRHKCQRKGYMNRYILLSFQLQKVDYTTTIKTRNAELVDWPSFHSLTR